MQSSPAITTEVVTKEYFIQRLAASNIAHLAQLHSEVYNQPLKEDYFKKKYNTAYAGVEHVGFIAYNQDRFPIAFYGVIPCYIGYKGKIMLAAQSADTMTHPRHRFKGMFVELSKMTFGLCRELGIRLIFGFPNENSYHGAINKLGWQLINRMDCFTIALRTIPLHSLAGRFSFLRDLYHRYTERCLAKYDCGLAGIEASAIWEGFAGVHRNSGYLHYKRYNQSRVLVIEDCKIWISNRHGLMIGDVEGITKENCRRILGRLAILGRKLGVRQIQFHCSPGTKLHEVLSLSLEPQPSFFALYQDLGSGIPVEMIRFSYADIDIF